MQRLIVECFCPQNNGSSWTLLNGSPAAAWALAIRGTNFCRILQKVVCFCFQTMEALGLL